MANDPKYVRLVDRMARSTQVDLNSGWSIAGLDVREFPSDDQPAAQSYVRDAIRRGTLEGCSKSEFEEVYGEEGSHDFLARAGVTVKAPEVEGHFQEAQVAGLATQERQRIEAARGLGDSSGLSYGDDKVRRAALLKAQAALDEGQEPDEDDALGESDVDADLGEGEDPVDEGEGGKAAPAKRAAKKAPAKKTSA